MAAVSVRFVLIENRGVSTYCMLKRYNRNKRFVSVAPKLVLLLLFRIETNLEGRLTHGLIYDIVEALV